MALLAQRPCFGLQVVRDLAAHDGLLTSEGTVYPLLNRLRDAGLVTGLWRHEAGERALSRKSVGESVADAGRGPQRMLSA